MKKISPWVLLLILFIWMCILLPKQNFDWWSFVTWAEYIREHGLSHIYDVTNYMPVSIFAISIWMWCADGLQLTTTQAVGLLKIYPLIFDFLTLGLLSWLMHSHRTIRQWKLVVFCVANLAFWYNSWIWGQFDGVYTFFVFLAFVLLWKKRFDWSIVALMLALNVKLQAAIFLPLYMLAGMTEIAEVIGKRQRKYLLRVVLGICLASVLQIGLFLPFAHSGPQIIQTVWQKSASLSQYVTFNADNFWIFVGAKTQSTLDTNVWMFGTSYRDWGWGLFFSTLLLILIPFIMLAFLVAKKRIKFNQTMKEHLYLLGLYLVSLSFFLFPTQIHERYVHPAVPFACALAVLYMSPITLCLCLFTSVAYLINLDLVMKFLFLFNEQQAFWLHLLSSWLYLISFVLGMWKLGSLCVSIWKRPRNPTP